MFGTNSHYHQFAKYRAVFGSLFNDLQIERRQRPTSNTVFAPNESDEGTTVQRINVPLSYVNKDKLLARVYADPAIARKDAILLPHMSYQFSEYTYNSKNMLRQSQRHAVKEQPPSANTPGIYKVQLHPTAYDIKATLW